MRHRTMLAGLGVCLCAVQVLAAAGASTWGTAIERGRFEERFFDDFILEL